MGQGGPWLWTSCMWPCDRPLSHKVLNFLLTSLLFLQRYLTLSHHICLSSLSFLSSSQAKDEYGSSYGWPIRSKLGRPASGAGRMFLLVFEFLELKPTPRLILTIDCWAECILSPQRTNPGTSRSYHWSFGYWPSRRKVTGTKGVSETQHHPLGMTVGLGWYKAPWAAIVPVYWSSAGQKALLLYWIKPQVDE